jgi:hypothetical protein
MPTYQHFFKKVISEEGPNYVASVPNTSGTGGALGSSASMYTGGSASGTPGGDTYATGDYRIPTSIFGGIIRRNSKKRKKTKNKKK